MENVTVDTSNSLLARTNVYHVSKRLLWLVLLVLGVVLTVLLVLTIYFGVKQNDQNRTIDNFITLLTTNATLIGTTTSNGIVNLTTPSPPIARVPNHLQQLSYHLTITPNLTNRTFTGKKSFLSNRIDFEFFYVYC